MNKYLSAVEGGIGNPTIQNDGSYIETFGIKNPLLPETLQQKSGSQFLSAFFPPLIGMIFVIGSVGFFFMLLFGAIQWIFSGGDKGAVEQARGRISNALIGIVLLFSSFALISVIEAFFGLNILTIDIGPLKIQ